MRLPAVLPAFVLISALGCATAPDALRQAGGKAPEAARAAEPAPERKIIYTGEVHLIVDDFDQAEGKLHALLREQNGYVARSALSGNPGSPRQGTWTVRVPAGKFDEVMAALAQLGELRQSSSDSQDVTDRYHDTKAEIRNLEAREEALRKLYSEKLAGSKLSELLEVSKELNNVRIEIDKRTGQLQRWDSEVAFATVVVNLQDRRGYVPPVVPDFGTSIGRTFQQSVQALQNVGQGLVLVLVAAAPWFAVLLVAGLPVRLLLRSRRAHHGGKAPGPRSMPGRS